MSCKQRMSFNQPNLVKRKRSRLMLPLIFFTVISLWSIALGWGMALAINAPTNVEFVSQAPSTPASASNNLRLGKKVYLENCSSCHTPIPPEVLPTETWKQILEKPQRHYGTGLPKMISPLVVLMWDYLRTFSRPLPPEAIVPEYVYQSRYFKALHPRVELPTAASHKTCTSCHSGAKQLDYRRLTPEWENAP